MPDKRRSKVFFSVVTVLAAVAIVSIAVWIMVRQMGLNNEMEFGAGAYYYTDNPQLQEEASRAKQSFNTGIPTWVHIVLFLAWGWLMWRLWVWVDGRINKKKEHGTDQ